MSFNITIEIEAGVRRQEVFRALDNANFRFSASDPTDGSVIGYFSNSGMCVFYHDIWMTDWVESKGAPFTNDARAKAWNIVVRLSMKYLYGAAEECDADLDAFVRSLDRSTSVKFVAAYDYEVLYAIKDVDGLKIFG